MILCAAVAAAGAFLSYYYIIETDDQSPDYEPEAYNPMNDRKFTNVKVSLNDTRIMFCQCVQYILMLFVNGFKMNTKVMLN